MMKSPPICRRRFLQGTMGSGAAAWVPYWLCGKRSLAAEFRAKNDRPLVACIGTGGRGMAIAQQAARFGDVVAVCDVDLERAEKAKQKLGGKARVYQDYRRLLDRHDVEVITNGTPDHWHTLVNISACRSGRDVYTEKPMTLTIDEGKILCRVVAETGRVVQVGTQQRSVPHFRTACELVRNGRIGRLEHVAVLLPFWNTKGGPFAAQPVPESLDWDLWQGQAPVHEFCPQRLHFNFRWWFEYAGGIITDWGQHHMDIAHWGMDMEHSGPLEIEGKANFPNAGRPDCFNNPDRFVVKMKYPGEIDLLYLVVRDKKYLASMAAGDISKQAEADLFAGVPEEFHHEQRNGIMFTGEKGRIFVNRGGLFGKAAEELAQNPLPGDAVRLAQSTDHMGNFFQCVKSRQKPIADVTIGHHTITACHLGNIAMRLGRTIRWDTQREQIVGDDEANRWLSRPQRAPYVIRG